MGIVDDFYTVRMKGYSNRRLYLLNKYEKELEMISEKERFVRMIVKNELNILGKKKLEIHDVLKSNGFKTLTNKNNYDYLLNMSIWNLSNDNLEKLTKEKETKELEFNELNNSDPSQLWRSELIALRKLLKKKDSDRIKNELKEEKKLKKNEK